MKSHTSLVADEHPTNSVICPRCMRRQVASSDRGLLKVSLPVFIHLESIAESVTTSEQYLPLNGMLLHRFEVVMRMSGLWRSDAPVQRPSRISLVVRTILASESKSQCFTRDKYPDLGRDSWIAIKEWCIFLPGVGLSTGTFSHLILATVANSSQDSKASLSLHTSLLPDNAFRLSHLPRASSGPHGGGRCRCGGNLDSLRRSFDVSGFWLSY